MTAAERVYHGPNDVQGCPSEACRRWHLAHGYLHVCGVTEPNFRRPPRTVPAGAYGSTVGELARGAS